MNLRILSLALAGGACVMSCGAAEARQRHVQAPVPQWSTSFEFGHLLAYAPEPAPVYRPSTGVFGTRTLPVLGKQPRRAYAVAIPAASPIRVIDSALHGIIDAAAAAAGVPLAIAHAVIRQESGYQPRIRGAAGEYGLGQIMCGTARGVGFVGNCAALLDPTTNARYSMQYLALAIRKGGGGCAGVSYYQSGLAGPPRCSGYGRQVMGRVR